MNWRDRLLRKGEHFVCRGPGGRCVCSGGRCHFSSSSDRRPQRRRGEPAEPPHTVCWTCGGPLRRKKGPLTTKVFRWGVRWKRHAPDHECATYPTHNIHDNGTK